MKKLVIYIHGKGGTAQESEHYKPLFPEYDVIGLDYTITVPSVSSRELRMKVEDSVTRYESAALIANSIGAFYSMCAGLDNIIQTAYFISPIVDMEKLICDMMSAENVSEAELRESRVISTSFGEELSWDYLCFVRENPITWSVPTKILYGMNDFLTSYETIKRFADRHFAELTVMENGEHWFHTDEQMRFLDNWIVSCR